MSYRVEKICRGEEYYVDLYPLGYHGGGREGTVVALTDLVGRHFRVRITSGLKSYLGVYNAEFDVGVDSDFHKAMTLIPRAEEPCSFSFDDMMNGVGV